MSLETVLVFIAATAYFLFGIVRARKAIWSFGPAMTIGIATALATVVFGWLRPRPYYFSEIMAGGSGLAFILVTYALWGHRNLLQQGDRIPDSQNHLSDKISICDPVTFGIETQPRSKQRFRNTTAPSSEASE
jgi:hypothetical protein